MAYTPGNFIGKTPEAFQEFVMTELQRLSKELSETLTLELRQSGRAPNKPRAGMIVSADGVAWNPGAGAGAYEYKGGVWVKL